MIRVKFIVARNRAEAKQRVAAGFGHDSSTEASAAILEVTDPCRSELSVWIIQIDEPETKHKVTKEYLAPKRPYNRKDLT